MLSCVLRFFLSFFRPFVLSFCLPFYLIASRIPPGQVSRKMQSQYGPTSAGKGHENRRPWVQKGAPQVKFRPPRGSSGVLLGRLGRQVGLRRALWAEKRSLKIVWRALGTILGSSWRVLGPFWVAFLPPLGAPGRLQEVIFRRFWDVPAEILKMSFCLSFFHIVVVFFSVLLFALCCLPCSVAGGVLHM